MQSIETLGPMLLGVPVAFLLFGTTLVGVAVFHHRTLLVALAGLVAITLLRVVATHIDLGAHLTHEWVTLANLFGLLVGFAVLAAHVEHSGLPELLPRVLPQGGRGAFALLGLVFALSGVLDNIAAALIGGTVAAGMYGKRNVHVGYLAAIVAAANAGGSGSVVGDTTTTMMWIAGVAPTRVLHAYLGAAVALACFGVAAALQQSAKMRRLDVSPTATLRAQEPKRLDVGRLVVVGIVLGAVVATNVTVNATVPKLSDELPVLGLVVWVALLLTLPFRAPDWTVVPGAAKGSLFLLALVVCASLMPVAALPAPSWPVTLGLGFLSSVFDNIPLTRLALAGGGYDWGLLAYSVGFGGSMLWFGSSAGVAIVGQYPEARSVVAWLRAAWYLPLAYASGFVAQLVVFGWHP